MNEISQEVSDIERNLGVAFPNSYKDFLLENRKSNLANGLPIFGLSIDSEIDSVWGATETLRLARPDLPYKYIAIRFLDSRALCIEIDNSKAEDPLFEINLTNDESPKRIHESFGKYIKECEKSEEEIDEAFSRIINLFNHDLKIYDRNGKGELIESIPFKARDWRIMRSSVHDQVVGLTAIRYNEEFNGLEVDVFISTDHPNYESGHGIRALMMLLLSDAYKNGATMEMRFTRFIIGQGRVTDKIPNNLVNLFKENKISLSKYAEGIITHSEAVNLYAAILGIKDDLKGKIREHEKEGRLSLQGLCYIVCSRLWTIEEASWILLNCPRPEGVLFGKDIPEDRIRYLESLSYGRTTLAMTRFRSKLENNIFEKEIESVVEVNGLIWMVIPRQSCELDWSISPDSIQIKPEERIAVLSRPRRISPNEEQLIEEDLLALTLNAKDGSKKFLLYSSDFLNIKNYIEIINRIRDKKDTQLIILPLSCKELDEEVNDRMAKARVVRA